ncbi:YaaL family protein [Lacticaseibacillus parakribbianus]|uniref:YaaL family protein n=1 Tax=Lacticaseibacillus parakribbianus TaxID=2970927 RepID=UPI0021CAEC40|nr:YaaL family protein [Lacticaseibacillus parakribbianus]
MFFKKRPNIKTEADRELMTTVYRVRDKMAAQRKLVATFREVDEATRAQVNLQEGLFDFLHRQARVREVSGALVAEMAAQQLQEDNQSWQLSKK